jgi:diguanylate cyclase (GGDEF)-like protein/PAS domain S-box-containing protein
MKISQKLTIGYLAVALLVGVMGFLGIRAIAKTQQEFEQTVQRAMPIRDGLNQLQSTADDVADYSQELALTPPELSLSLSQPLGQVVSNGSVKGRDYAVNSTNQPTELSLEQSKKRYTELLVGYEQHMSAWLPHPPSSVQAVKTHSDQLLRLVADLTQLRQTNASRSARLAKQEEIKTANRALMRAIAEVLKDQEGQLEAARLEMQSTVSSTMQGIVVTGVMAFTVAGLMGGWVAASIIHPLKKLQEAAVNIGQGKLRTKIEVSEADELGELAQTFNKMAEELWRTTTYAVKVRESLVESLIVLTPNNLRIHSVNKATCELLGYRRSELVGKPLDRFLPAVASLLQDAKPKQLSEQGFIYSIETTYESKDGRRIPVLFSASLMREHDEVLGIVCVAQDNTVRHRHEATIRYQASHDLLTGLPNRALFDSRLAISLAQAAQSRARLAVMFLDLDRFKLINDTLGHAVGDRLLQGFSQRISGCLRQSDTIARWGGDEFTVLLPNIRAVDEATTIAYRILDALKPHFELEGHVLRVSSSIGISIYPTDGEDAETLLKNADAALYRAKEGGRNSYCLYTAAINSQASERLALENQLHHALERNELTLYYQPLVNTATGQISQMEALLRWHHPEMGMVSPNRFIPLAEENGLIVPIGEWVLRTACSQTRAWHEAGLPQIRVGVNLSAQQFRHPDLVSMIGQILQETRLDPCFLELEITETTVITNVESAKIVMDELTQMGISIAMDDFGNGYSSLSYLKKFPFHTLKIDQGFVRDITTDPNDRAIVTAIAALGKVLNLKLVAEGVETDVQERLLRSLNCHEMQGYLFSPPLPADEATRLLLDPQFPQMLLSA